MRTAIPLSFNHEQFELLPALNNHWLRDVRKSMLNGKQHPNCVSCWQTEASGNRSMRQIWNDQFQDSIPSQIANVEPDGTIKSPPGEYLDLSLGNLCNLRCRTCFSSCSKQWVRDERALGARDLAALDLHESLDWAGSPVFWRNFSELIPKVRQINFVGGEPLIIDAHFEILRRLVAHGNAGLISVAYNTNLTKLSPELFSLWSHFKKINLSVSIDAYGSLNEYIRYPSKWQKLLENLQTLKTWKSQLPLNILAATTLQALNVNNLPELIKFIFSTNFFDQRIPLLTWVANPDYHDPRVLPLNARADAAAKISELIAELYAQPLEAGERAWLDTLKHYSLKIHYGWEEKFREIRFQRFIEITESLDKLRNQDVNEFIPQWLSWKNSAAKIYENVNKNTYESSIQ